MEQLWKFSVTWLENRGLSDRDLQPAIKAFFQWVFPTGEGSIKVASRRASRPYNQINHWRLSELAIVGEDDWRK